MLAKRKGFVRVALETGAVLVPVITFGETDIFTTYMPKPNSWADWILRCGLDPGSPGQTGSSGAG